jgi:hypothetical protein
MNKYKIINPIFFCRKRQGINHNQIAFSIFLVNIIIKTKTK